MGNTTSAGRSAQTVPDAGFSFDQVIAPVTRSEFFAKHYEREELIVQRGDPAHYASLLSLDKIDEYITTSNPNSSQVMMVNALADIKASDYSDSNGMIDVARLYQLFDEGATITIPGLQRKIPELAALCRAVEAEFDARFQANIYLSPPNAQGFKTHYDTHDVLVLQVAGSKQWRSYDVPVELPLLGQKFSSDKYTTIPPVHEFRLNAGDLYYCPRGLVHDASSTDDISLHITFGVMAQTWTELMVEAVTAACVSDPAFRANLPVGFASNPDFDRGPAREKFQSLLTSFVQSADIDVLLDQMGEAFVAERKPLLRGQMHQMRSVEQIDGQSRIMARPDLIYTVAMLDGSVEVRSGSTVLTLPAHVTPILTEILATNAPTILSAFSGNLDSDGRVVLAKRLLREGLISVSHG
jgi:ribosomal protein L16 Arg81 hydroxylase